MAQSLQPLLTRQRLGLLAALFTLLTAIYLLTYSGRIESGDTLSLFDAATSLFYYGDDLFDQSAAVNLPPLQADNRTYPLKSVEVEPLHDLLALGLISIADRLPGVGLVHTVWLLNVFLCAAAVGTLFVYVLALGYGDLTAALAALLLGLATILWPYSKTFFREPLALWLTLLAALLLERWRARQYRSWPLLIGSVLAVGGAFFSKEAVIFAIPSLILIGFPTLPVTPRWLRRVERWLLGLILLGVVVFIVTSIFAPGINFAPMYLWLGGLFGQRWWHIARMHMALHSYLLSPGGSIWGTSPVLLLALPGMWQLFRRGQTRYLWVALLMTLAFVGGYTYLRGVHWFGGLSWPPRFLVPVVPFLLLVALPVLERLTQKPRSKGLIAVVALLVVYSVWIQLNGITLPWGAYTAALPTEANGLSEWGGGLNMVQYFRWVVIPGLWSQTPLDFVWKRVDNPLWPLLFVTLALVSGWQLVARLRRMGGLRCGVVPGGLLPVLLLVSVYVGLRSIYDDPLYQPVAKDALTTALTALQAETAPGDVLLLSNDTYAPFFLNYGKTRYPRVIVLPDQPGEQPSPEQPPVVESVNPAMLLIKETIPLLFNLAGTRERLWLLADLGPWHPWSTRPVEQFLAANYYPIREISPDPTVRLIEYATITAPDRYAFRGPDVLADLRYDRQIRLAGFTLPGGPVYRPGDILALSLYWQAEKSVSQDVTIAWFLVDQTGAPVAQGMDSPPDAGFAPSSEWQPGVPVWDNRALRLPEVLSPGSYRLWVRLYYWESGAVQLLPVHGAETADATTGILPITIEIQAR